MIIKQLAEIIFKFSNAGRPKVTAQSIDKATITQMVMLTFGNILRQRYYESKKLNDFGQPDYSAISPVLGTIEFKLSDTNKIGMRRADMSQYDLYRLPNDAHITNIYPISGSCGSEELGKISLVEAGEERFYLTPEFSFFLFGVVKGRGINLYHLPPCVNCVGIETTYNSSDVDVSFEIGEEIALHILGVVLKIPAFSGKVIDNPYSPPQVDLRRELLQNRVQNQKVIE